jgi:elongation factor G
MKVYDAAAIRNVALVGTADAARRQLVSAMLFARRGQPARQVDDGTTTTDFDEEEIARKHTLSSSLAYAEWQKTKINIIDTPGFANFLTDARAALRVAEAALVVVDAVPASKCRPRSSGPRPPRSTCPRIVVVNRLDRERASLERTLESLHRDCAARSCRSRCRSARRRLHRRRRPRADEGADVCRRRQRQDDRRRRSRRPRRPRRQAREQLIEMVAEADEQLMETLLRRRDADPGAARRRPARRHVAGKLFPLVCTSGLHAIGIQPLLDAIVSYVPSPAERDFPPLTRRRETHGQGVRQRALRRVRLEDDCRPVRRPNHDARVVTGTLKSDAAVHNLTRDTPERFGHLLLMQCKTQTQ